jgi:hypothetical protein
VSDEVYPTFRTKTGVCTITPEAIHLTREGVRGASADALLGSGSIGTRLIVYAVLGVALLGIGVRYLSRQKYGDAAVPVAMGGFLLITAIRSRHNTACPVIPRNQIQSISATRPVPPATRGFFTVQFLQGTRSVNRLIILPGVLDGGQAEFDKAIEVFHSCGLTVL